MASDLRQKVRGMAPLQETRQREFEQATGINVETDIDRVVVSVDSFGAGGGPGSGLVLARGRFNEVKVEALMRDHGAQVEQYKGKRLVMGNGPVARPDDGFVLSFVEPGLAAIGSARLVRAAIDLQRGGDNVTTNEDVMRQVRLLDSADGWVVARLEALRSSGRLPPAVTDRMPAITWFSLSGQVNSGVRGTLRAEARDDEAAKNLREVANGFLALARLQAGANPLLQPVVQSLELGGTGKVVSVSFAMSADALNTLAAGHQPPVSSQPGH
jgi:hypothetical protein